MTLSIQATDATSITIPYVFVPNTTIFSAQVNADFSVIASVVNGNLDNSNLSAGANISLSKLNRTQTFLDLQSASGILGVGVGQTGDSTARVGLYSDGSIKWGAGGSAAPDVGVSRTIANTIQINNGTLNSGPAFLDLTFAAITNIPLAVYPGGRIYLGTGAPYSDHAATSNIFYGPATNNSILLFNASSNLYLTQSFAEASGSVGSLTPNTVYDVYINSASSSTVALSFVAWGGLNTPPTRGIDSFGRAIQNMTPANLFVGAIYVNSSNQVTDNTSTRGVSNIYNTILRAMTAADPSTASATSSIAPVDGSTTDGVGRCSFVSAMAGKSVNFNYSQTVQAGTTESGSFGLGLNSTTAYNSNNQYSGVAVTVPGAVTYGTSMPAGYSFMQKLCQFTLTGLSLLGTPSNYMSGEINN